MRRLVEIKPKKEFIDRFVLQWNLGNICNWNCSYCHPLVKSGSVPWPSLEVVERAINNVKNHAEDLGKNLEIILSGGEITLHPDLFDIFKLIKNQNIKLSFFSNGSRTVRYWEDLFSLELDYETLIFSYHVEFVDLDHFTKIVKLAEAKANAGLIMITIQMLPDEKMFNKQAEDYETLVQNFENLCILPLIPMTEDGLPPRIYSDEQHDWLLKNNHNLDLRFDQRNIVAVYEENGTYVDEIADFKKIFLDKDNNFYGWNCNIGLDRVYINMRGQIFNSRCRVGGMIGNIYEEAPINFLKSPTVCPRDICEYQSNVLISKKRS